MTRGSLVIDTAPADCWQDAFPVGNGRHGALVNGGASAESSVPERTVLERTVVDSTIVTHHHLAWPDGPAAPGPPDLADRLPRVQDLLLAGESRRALELFTGDWPRYHPRPFHPAFAILLRRDTPDPTAGNAASDGYRRTLNHRAGIAVTSWPGGRHVCFASRVRDLVVQQISGTAPWDAVVEVDAHLPGAPAGLRITGQVGERAPGDAVIVTTVEYPDLGAESEPSGVSESDGDVGAGGSAGNGGYVGVTRITATPGTAVTDGTVATNGTAAVAGGRAVRVTGCRELTLLTRVAVFRDAAGIGTARAEALAAVAAGPASEPRLLLAEHTRAHAAAFGDAALDLGAAAADRRLPVGELLARQAARPDRPMPALLEKLFSSGRYLLLSASGLLPSRLTGLWQGDWNSAWSGAITTDANLGLQLAGAVTTDVPTAVDALAKLVRQQLPDWRVNARRLFGTHGIVAPAHTDGYGGLSTHFEPRWPLHMWTAGADWLLVPVLDEALARSDPGYTSHHAGQALRELATFYEDFLTRTDCDGHVVFAPSYSPENEPEGWTPAAVNATMDIAAARHALLAAADSVQDDAAKYDAAKDDAEKYRDAAHKWRELAERLPPYRLTPDGALAEWSWPPAGTGRPPLAGNDEHRHVSHLYPVWPLHEITVAGTPALAAAALLALRLRGAQDDSAHGYLHKALAAARLRDADLAGRLLAALTGLGFFFRSLMSSHYPHRDVYNADAACALPGLLTEMLVDSVPASDSGPCRIELLPAVPDFLCSGRLRGARTLAGVRVAELRWDSVAGWTEAMLLSATDREADISCRGSASYRRVRLPAGLPIRLTWGNDDG